MGKRGGLTGGENGGLWTSTVRFSGRGGAHGHGNAINLGVLSPGITTVMLRSWGFFTSCSQ